MERRNACLFDPLRNKTTKHGPSLVVASLLLVLAVGMILSTTYFAAFAAPPEKNAVATTAEAALKPDDPQLAGRFHGTVLDTDGKPIAHAQIYVAPYIPTLKSIGRVRTETDADGHFAFDAPDMTYIAADGLPARREGLLVATAKGFAPDWMQTWGQNSESGSHSDPVEGEIIRLYLPKDDVPIHGRFLEPEGKPLANARVRIEYFMIPWKRDLDQAIQNLQTPFVVPEYERPIRCSHLLPGLTNEFRTNAEGRFTLSGIGRERLVQLQVSAPSIVDTRVMVMTRAVPDFGIHRDANGVPGDLLHGADFTRQLKPPLGLLPSEARDLGEIRTQKPVDVRGK